MEKYQNKLKEYAKLLEGPLVLRGASLLSAAGLIGGTLYSMVSWNVEWANQPSLLLKGYIIFFSIIVIINELKSFGNPSIQGLKSWTDRWLTYLSACWGKGLHNMFTGSLGVAYHDNLYVFVPAAVMMAVGVVYVLIHFGKCKQMSEAQNQASMVQSQMLGYSKVQPYPVGAGGGYQMGNSRYQSTYYAPAAGNGPDLAMSFGGTPHPPVSYGVSSKHRY